jgi:hypothetical protein
MEKQRKVKMQLKISEKTNMIGIVFVNILRHSSYLLFVRYNLVREINHNVIVYCIIKASKK